jgi:SAM-dependent methyltransferase
MDRADPSSAEGDAQPRTRFVFGPVAREYDCWYRTSAGRAHDRVQKADVDTLLPRPRPGAELLDVGCGTGHWTRFFAGLGYQVHGVDLSGEMIAVAEAHDAPICTFAVADAAYLPFPDARFDVVAAMAVLEFVPDAAAVIREMARCTRGGGSILIGTLNRLSELNRRRLAGGKEPYVSAKLLAPDELKGLLSAYGEVRMRASSLPAADTDSRSGASAVDHDTRRAPSRPLLNGPFLVAEVQR